MDDSFFDLGGDSLSAMRLIAAVNTALDAGLSVRVVFEAPTIAQLAPRIGGEEAPARAAGGRLSGPRWFRCRSPRTGCGSSTNSRGRHRSTTWRWRCGCAGRSMPTHWVRRWPTWWSRQESLRTLFPAVEGIPQQLVMPAERADFGWQVIDATGWSDSRAGRGHRRRGASTRSIWQPKSLCGQGFSASPTTNTCWWLWCTTSPRTAGRSHRWWTIWGGLCQPLCRPSSRLGRSAGAVRRLHAVAARAVRGSRR